ncbi:MAG: hypothetical protein M3Q86_14210 [Verrucomicrobiota bacterium]|nr:hypothetical protein [Verrucomicrobiota bacterium]
MRFTPQALTAAKYDEVIRRLEAAGAGAPAGRLYHVCFGNKEELRVSEIWDSMENFEEFGKTLMPIMQDVGVDPGQPEIVEVHNIIKG